VTEPSQVPEPVAPSRTGRFASNIIFSAFGRGWWALLSVITVPIVVHGIGTSAYGIYALVMVVIGYVAALDFGLTAAVVRSVSKYRAAGDMRAMERVVGTAFTLLIGVGVLGGIAIFLVGPLAVDSIFHIPGSLHADAVFAFQVTGIGFGFNMVLIVFAAIVQGLQRFDIFASRAVILSTANSVAQIAAVTLGGGLRWLVVLTLATGVFSLVIFLAAARRLLPGVSFRPRLNRPAIGELAGFGLFRFLNQASGQVTFQLDLVIIGIFQPIAAVAYYSVPLAVTQKFHLIEDSVASAYFPAAVELHSRGDRERAVALYQSAFKLVFVAMAFLIVLCVGYASPILTAWVGASFAARASAIFAVLAIGYGLSAIVGIPAQASDATGHQRWTAGFAVASAMIQLTLALVLVPRYGPIGAAIALVINTVTQGTLFVWLVHHRFLHVSTLTLMRTVVLRPLLASVGLGLFVLVTRGYLHNTALLLVTMAFAGVLYAGLTLVLGVWTKDEVLRAKQLARSAWAAIWSRGRARAAGNRLS
jgi:O-antigen/teichoic acid export membrane protein